LTRDSNEIEELVRIAAQEKDPAARRRLFRALRPAEFFFPLNIKHHEGKEVRATPLLRLPDGTNAMMLYTSKSHPDLPDSFGGGSFKDALAAALKMPALDWVILSNRASQWVAIRKEQISTILGDLHSDGKEENGPLANSGSGPTDKMLEDLITRAVHSTPEQLSPPIDSVLPGRELYLELTAEHSAEGQPIMKTFQVNDTPNVVRAYLTRSRPGITYGGIRWEVLKEMIRNEPGIDGVQIVNDADDWVVFDRESLRFGPNDDSQ
jgi:SseB protein N-terminal domain